MELVRKIHAQIVAKDQLQDAAEMKDYSAEVPQTGAPYQMVAVQGGEFLMGSDDEDAKDSEKPQHTVYLDAFWMDMHPVSNAQFAAFVSDTKYKTKAEKEQLLEILRNKIGKQY